MRARSIALVLVGILPLGAPGASTGTRTALVIGNARYEPSVGALRNSVNDAKAVARALRELGFSVSEHHNVTRDQLLGAVGAFRRKLAGAEVALFYYAGHGISVAGSNYLLPVRSGYDPADADEASLRLLAETKLFNAEQAVAEMTSAGAACNIVILDACRNTPVARNPRMRSVSGAGGLAEMNPPAGSLIAFATDAGRVAHDGAGANGLYTAELLKFMRTPGLTIEQVFKRTRAAVLERSDGAQIPAEYSRLVGDDIFLAGAPSSATVTRSAESSVPELSVPKAEMAGVPTDAELAKLAAAGPAGECVAALRRVAATRGPGDYAAAPLDTLLEKAKEDLKGLAQPGPRAESALQTCEMVLSALNDCLPANDPRRAALMAKAQNRRGDALLIFGRTQEALAAYVAALPLAPDDAYIRYNRGRAHQLLGNTDAARGDFQAVIAAKTAKPGAKKLAQEALAKLE